MDTDPFLLLLHCSQWESPKKNSNLCLPARIRSRMRNPSVGVVGFGDSLVSDAFSFCFCLFQCSSLLCFGCPHFFTLQIRRICMPIQNTKVGLWFWVLIFEPPPRFSVFFFFFLGLWVSALVYGCRSVSVFGLKVFIFSQLGVFVILGASEKYLGKVENRVVL